MAPRLSLQAGFEQLDLGFEQTYGIQRMTAALVNFLVALPHGFEVNHLGSNT